MRVSELTRSRRGAAVFFTVLLAVMVGHEAEHLAQVAQKDVQQLSCPNECRGLLGHYFDVEWVHFAYNGSILLALLGLAVWLRIWRSEWRLAAPSAWAALTGGVLLQTYHFVEHTEKLSQWLDNGRRSPTPGFLGQLLAPAEGRNFSLIELHFALNTAVLVPVVGAYLGLGFHRRIWAERTRPRLVLAAVVGGAALVATGVGWAAAPPTVRLAAGVHAGPIVLDRPQRLVGEPGAIVRGGVVVASDDVVVRDLTVEGGEVGIDVRPGSREVVLERVRVRGFALDGISARRASVLIRSCAVEAVGLYAQGIDISFGMGRPPSLVKGCRVRGGQDGILVNGADADVRGNTVSGTRMRAIAVSEMAMANVVSNRVREARGIGIYCGDYSVCDVERNTIDGVRPDGSDNLTQSGIAIVADYHASAFLRRNAVSNSARRSAAFVAAQIVRG